MPSRLYNLPILSDLSKPLKTEMRCGTCGERFKVKLSPFKIENGGTNIISRESSPISKILLHARLKRHSPSVGHVLYSDTIQQIQIHSTNTDKKSREESSNWILTNDPIVRVVNPIHRFDNQTAYNNSHQDVIVNNATAVRSLNNLDAPKRDIIK